MHQEFMIYSRMCKSKQQQSLLQLPEVSRCDKLKIMHSEANRRSRASSNSTVGTTIHTISTMSSSTSGGTKDRILRPKLIQSTNQNHIRHRYLGKLGFGHPPPQRKRPSTCSRQSAPTRTATDGGCKRSCTYRENLNDGDDEYGHSHASQQGDQPKRKVSFDNSVSVRVIPSIDMYSDRIRKTLWNTSQDLSRNAQRNLIEFAHEKYDFRFAVEEDGFFTCPTTGSLIHPAHVHWMDYVMANRRRSPSHLQRHRLPSMSHQATFRQQQQQTSYIY